MVRQKNYEPALRYIEKALGIKAESLINNCRKAQILLLMAHAKEAAECYIKAYHLDPTSAINFLNHHLVLPGIPSNSQDIEEARARFEAGLGLAENNALIQLRLDEDINPHIFELAYHNQDDRILLERYHALMNKLSNPIVSRIKASVSSSNQSTPEAGNSKVRIGFLSKFFSGHSNTLAFEGLICNLDRANFEVFLIHADGSKKDERRDSLDLVCDHSVQLNANYAEAYQTLVSLKLDILFFTDLGMNGWDFLIPLFRAAPIQMTGWGIPHTSGIREIDYYISSERLEPVGAESSYTEKLIKLPGGLPCCFLSESLDFTPLPRDYFFLPPGGTLFGCLQGLHKLHPDFDFILEAIAQANPDAGFVFVEDSVASRTKIFLDRLSRNAPTARERCITLAIMSRQEYHSICHGLDILLDPIYYGSGITFFEASFVGAPIVTMEGNALRSRVVACGYREMGLEHPPIATSAKEYVEIATTLANNIGRRQSLRNEILSKNHLIFNRMSYVRDFEKFCLDKVYSIRDHLAII
jgi:protein O-GlcNAc transferase